MTRSLTALIAASILSALSAPAAAQYHWESVPEVGIKIKVPDKLQSIPLKLGGDRGNLHAKWEPDTNGWIHGKHGRYSWEIEVYAFGAPPKKPDTGEGSKPTTREEAEEAARAELAARRLATTFDDWVRNKDLRLKPGRAFLVEGELTRGRGKSLPYKNWEYQDYQQETSTGRAEELIWHQFAAVAEVDGREVAVVINMPGDDKGKIAKRGGVKSKYVAIASTILSSITPMSEKEIGDVEEGDEDKDAYAQTDEQKAALDAARKNIAGLDGWDYFTSPNYIVLYSFPSGAADKATKARKFARKLVNGVEDVRTEYERFYPPHDAMGAPYSVLRVCADYQEFRQYGEVPYGVVGFFSPQSKELVMFYDSQKEFGGEDYVVQVAFHEAWHQYSDAYFGSTELHRWFDEGTGDFFGGFTKSGRRWKYDYDKGRYQSIRAQVARGNFIPLAEIVTWNKDKFYGARGPDHYAQGYSVIDFLYRGEKRTGRKWDARWNQILPLYVKTCLETKSQKKAVEAAFDGVDFDAFESAWIDWVKTHMKSDNSQPQPMEGLQ